MIECVPPDNRTAHIVAPCSGKVSATAAKKLASGQFAIPDGPLFTLKTYSANGETADAFQDHPLPPTKATPPLVTKPVARRRKKWIARQRMTFFAIFLAVPLSE